MNTVHQTAREQREASEVLREYGGVGLEKQTGAGPFMVDWHGTLGRVDCFLWVTVACFNEMKCFPP